MTVTVTWTPVQWGFASAGVWSDSAMMPLTPDGSTGGIVFDANNHQSLDVTTVGGDQRILDGPLLLTFGLTVDANRGAATTTPCTLEFGVVSDAQPANFSSSLLPWNRNEASLGTFVVTVAETPAFTTLSLAMGAEGVTMLRAHAAHRSRWNGRIAISVRNISTVASQTIRLFSTGGIAAFATTTQEQRFFSGLQGGPTGPRQRIVRDSRFGMPAVNSELIQDGDNPGLWVRASDWDPKDPPASYKPRSGEGTVDDGIPED